MLAGPTAFPHLWELVGNGVGIGWDLSGNLLGFDGGSAHFWELFRFLWELVGNRLGIDWG